MIFGIVSDIGGNYRMAYIRYTIYPDCPEATAYSQGRAYGAFFLGILAVFGSIASVIWFVQSTISLFYESKLESFFYSAILLVFFAVIDLLFVFHGKVTDRELQIILAMARREKNETAVEAFKKQLRLVSKKEMKDFSKRYFLFFFGGALSLIGLIGTITGIYLLCHNQAGLLLLILSSVATVSIVILLRFLYSRIKQVEKPDTILKASIHENSINNEAANHKPTILSYCHKCGAKITEEGVFCHKCGNKVIKKV
jgi:hypothetical protein